MRNSALRTQVLTLLLALLLFGSLGLRIWGVGFGLPAYARYHPDEHALVERAAQILWTGNWKLERFNYPPAYAYVQAIAYAIYFLYGVSQGLWEQLPLLVVPNYYMVGRVVTAIFGTLTIVVVYLAARQLHNRRTGVLAATLLGGNYLHIIHSHYATFDVMVGFWVALTLLFSALLRDRQEARWYLLAGLCAGLAGATKYNGAVAIILPLLAHILSTQWGEWGWLDGRLFLSIGAFLLGFFGGNPYALGNLPEFLGGLGTVLHHYETQQPGFEGQANWKWYPSVFLRSADSIWVVAGTFGLLSVFWKDWRKGLLLLSFPIIYYAMAARFVVRFERNMVPLLPFLAIGGGWLITVIADSAAQRFERPRQLSTIVTVLLVFLVLALPLIAAISFDLGLTRIDHRELAGQWVEENIESGSKIAIEHYSIPFDHDRYEVTDVVRASDHDLAWYQQEGFDVLIVSDGVWEILKRQPQYYGEKLDTLAGITESGTLLAEFVPEPPGIVVAGYPTVAVYHYAPVRIYQLPQAVSALGASPTCTQQRSNLE
ncbi:MAG: glycosyltransferase family 39 protein [Anaerolineae bacterium]|jgi:4-amino-4-deoxy-L-arabinose transferase-like glycosyltransferase